MTVLKPHPDVIETPLEDELVLLDPKTQQMYSLNATGKLIWETLKAGDYPLVAQKVSAEFEVEAEQAQLDADALISDLERTGLLVRA